MTRRTASSAPLTAAQQAWAEAARAEKRAARAHREQQRHQTALAHRARRRDALPGEAAAFAITVPGDQWMTSNHRSHHHGRTARATRTLRARALAAAVESGLPRFTRTRLTVQVGYPTRRRADPLNAERTIKAVIDGLVDAGVWPDDDHEHITEVTTVRDPQTIEGGMHRIRLVIVELDPAGGEEL